MKRLSAFKLKRVLESVAAIATIFGIYWAVQQFFTAKENARTAQTLNYVARFNSDPTLKSLVSLYTAYQKDPEAFYRDDDPTKAEVAFIKRNNLDWDSILLGDFFDQLYVCIISDICDKSFTVKLLGRDIEGVYVLAGRYLQAEHKPTGCGLSALFEAIHPILKYARMKASDKAMHNVPQFSVSPSACPTF